MDEFLLDEDNRLLKEHYKNGKNCLIRDTSKPGVCYIFCSSNGIYYPNTESEFVKTIIEQDRYEWEGVAASDEVREASGYIIFVRDIYKQYYVKGINERVNTIEKLCSFLKEKIPKDVSVVTCGISSGGYLATILGIYLQAACVFNFGGQWSLYDELRMAEADKKLGGSYYFLREYRDNREYNQFYDITTLLNNNKVPIMYFYSALEEGDKAQVQILEKANGLNIWCFAMKSSVHGYTLFNSCYRKALTCPLPRLMSISDKSKGKLISLQKFAFYLLNRNEAIKECVRDVVQKHKSLQLIAKIKNLFE